MKTRRWWLAAALLASASWAADDRVVAIAAFTGEGGDLAQMATAVVQVFLDSRGFANVIRDADERTSASASVELKVVHTSTGRLLAAAQRVSKGRGLQPDLRVTGKVGKREGEVTLALECTEVETAKVVATAFGSSLDAGHLAEDMGRVLYARLSGNSDPGLDAEQRRVRNDNSTLVIGAELDRAANGDYPIYRDGDRSFVKLTSSEPAYALLLSVGSDGVHQLFPMGTNGEMDKVLRRELTVPNASYKLLPRPPEAPATYDPSQGFLCVGDAEGIERLHLFVSRKPILTAELPQVPDNLTATEYYQRWLPKVLRPLLSKADGGWQGQVASYYYAAKGSATVGPTLTARGATTAKTARPQIVVQSVMGLAGIDAADKDGEAVARDNALFDLRRHALEQGLGCMVKSETEVSKFELIKDKIELKSTAGYVSLVLPLLEDRKKDGLWCVRANAVVSTEPLVAMFTEGQKRAAYLEFLGTPKLALPWTEVIDGTPQTSSAAESAFAANLLTDAFTVVDLKSMEHLGQGDAVRQGGSEDERARRAALEKFALKSDLALLLSSQASGGGGVSDCKIALKRAADDLYRASVDQLLSTWLATPSMFVLQTSGAPRSAVRELVRALTPAPPRELDQVDLAKEQLKRQPPAYVERVKLLGFSEDGIATLDISSQLRPERFGTWLEDKLEQLGWEVKANQLSRWHIVPKAK